MGDIGAETARPAAHLLSPFPRVALDLGRGSRPYLRAQHVAREPVARQSGANASRLLSRLVRPETWDQRSRQPALLGPPSAAAGEGAAFAGRCILNSFSTVSTCAHSASCV